MRNKYAATVYRTSENYEVIVEALSHLRQQFLKMPFEEFVKIEALRRTFPEKKEISDFLSGLWRYLDFGTDSFRYFMKYLGDEKTAEVAEADAGHDIHTDMWGRIRNRHALQALGFAMGFQYFSKELNAEELGFESDPGYAEETVSTEFGDVQISGLKNEGGNFHGYCEITQSDGAVQNCFFNDGKILARYICYPNGMGENVKDCDSLVVDPYAPRTVYELCSTEDEQKNDCIVFDDGKKAVRKVPADRKTVEEIVGILGAYSVRVEYRRYVSYPYSDEDVLEIESGERTPTVDMAITEDGRPVGVLFKTTGTTIIPLDYVGRTGQYWKILTVKLDEEIVLDQYTVSLRKKDEKGDSEK